VRGVPTSHQNASGSFQAAVFPLEAQDCRIQLIRSLQHGYDRLVISITDCGSCSRLASGLGEDYDRLPGLQSFGILQDPCGPGAM
jgi:hypothetical protein